MKGAPKLKGFTQSLGPKDYRVLMVKAKAREMTLSEFVRVVVIPEWIMKNAQPRLDK